MKAGQYDKGCPALADSYRLDPRIGVLFTLAECESKWGKIASSLNHYGAYLDAYGRLKADEQARQGRRREVAQSQKQALDAQVPRLTVTLARGVPAGTTVVCDNVALQPAQIGEPVPLDPGDHTVAAHQPDGATIQRRVTLAIGEQRTLELGGNVAAPSSVSSAPTPAEGPTEPAKAPGGKRSLALPLAAAAVGVVGIGVGSVTGLLAASKKGTIDAHCNGTLCDATGKDAADSAKGLATVSTVGFGVGIVGLATAAVLYFVLPPKKDAAQAWRPNLVVGPGTAGIGVGRSW